MPKLILFILVWFVSQIVVAEDLTLQQAAELMFKQNPALAQKEIESEISQKMWEQSRASYFPQLDFVQSLSQSNNPVYVFGTLLNQSRFTESNFAIDSLNHPDSISDNSSRFQLGWLLFDFGRRENKVSSAQIAYEISDLQVEEARADLLSELVRRYYAVSLARLRMETAEDAMKSAQATYEQARERVENGLAVTSDLLSAQVYQSRKKQQQIDSVQLLQNATAGFWELLGQQIDREITTTLLVEVNFPEQDLSWWNQQMKEHRPELKIVQEAYRMQQKQVGIQQSNFLPELHAWSSYEWHGSSLDYTGDSWGAGLELKWNLLRGNSDYQQLSSAKLKVKQASEKQRETENALWLQQQLAYTRYQSAKEKCKVSKESMQLALENRRIYAERYSSGLVSIQDSLQADSAYSETRLMYSQNLFELYVAYANLLAVAGKADEILKFTNVQIESTVLPQDKEESK